MISFSIQPVGQLKEINKKRDGCDLIFDLLP